MYGNWDDNSNDVDNDDVDDDDVPSSLSFCLSFDTTRMYGKTSVKSRRVRSVGSVCSSHLILR